MIYSLPTLGINQIIFNGKVFENSDDTDLNILLVSQMNFFVIKRTVKNNGTLLTKILYPVDKSNVYFQGCCEECHLIIKNVFRIEFADPLLKLFGNSQQFPLNVSFKFVGISLERFLSFSEALDAKTLKLDLPQINYLLQPDINSTNSNCDPIPLKKATTKRSLLTSFKSSFENQLTKEE